jgi:murein L,D-transpeptidase YcbB/YkuD
MSGRSLILAALAVVCSCRTYLPPPSIQQDAIVKVPRPTKIPDTLSDTVFAGLSNREAVVSFYRNQGLRLAWFDSALHDAGADSMELIIRNVRYFGLLPYRYHNSEIASLRETRLNGTQLPNNIQRIDALLTDAFLMLLKDLGDGVSRKNENPDSNYVALLQRAIRSSTLLGTLRSAEPSYFQYQNLKETIRTILDTTKSATREKILLGEISKTDPVMKLLQRVEINLERWRAENLLSEEGRYIYVNVPAFMLYVMNDKEKVLESRIIVGAAQTPTPVISSKVECFVIYPYWNVPRKISVEEYLPVIQHDTSFISRNNFDVLDRKGRVLRYDSINWKKFNKNYFPVSLRQREGKENSLGLIKFVFDNPYAVFVHDTNAKVLFRTNMRALSHGCIRLEKAFELGHYLLTETPAKKSEQLQRYLKQEQRRTISLAKPVPIYVRYFTCSVDNKKLYVYDDCYDLDRNLHNILYGFDHDQK